MNWANIFSIEHVSYLSCLGVSAVLCLWSLHHLSLKRSTSRGRIFWRQLTWMVGTDLCFCIWNITCHMLYVTEAIVGSHENCMVLMLTRAFLEYVSCILEIHIAAGFAAACCQSARGATFLRRTLPFCVVGGLMLAGALYTELDSTVQPGPGGCIYIRGTITWGTIVIALFLITTAFYVVSIFKTAGMPPLIRKRSLLRALTYILDMALTLFLKAFWQILSFFVPGLPGGGVIDVITNNLLALNGAANVLTYMFWMWRRETLELQSDQGDMMSLEALTIDGYFDLFETDDDITLTARALVASSIAEHSVMISLQPTDSF